MQTKDKTTLTIRVTKQTKTDAKQIFDSLGLDMSTAINLFLNQVATDHGLPFKPTTISPLDAATIRAEQDIEAGRVHEYDSFKDYQKKMNRL